jgi:HEAT repeat protein
MLAMSKRLRIAALLVPVLAALTWLLLPLKESEPIVDGKPLSNWVNYYTTARSEAQSKMADQALDKVGTNAIPTLLRMLRRTDSPFKRKVMDLLGKQHFIRVSYIPAERQNQAAYFAFLRLGTNADVAVPALMEIYERGFSPFSRQCAAGSLRPLGPAANAAIPLLQRGLADTNTLVRCDTLLALSSLQPELVISTLTNALTDPDAKVRGFACQALPLLGRGPGAVRAWNPDGTWAKQAVAALARATNDPDHMVRGQALMAFQQLEAFRRMESLRLAEPARRSVGEEGHTPP